MDLTYSKADNIFNAFEKRLTGAYRREIAYNLARNLLSSVIFILIIGFLLIILEAIFHFRSPVRTILFWVYIPSSISTIIYLILNYFLKRFDVIKSFDFLKYAKKVGGYFTNIKDSIANSLSLYKLTSKKDFDKLYFSENLILANLEKTNSETEKINLSSFISYKNLKNSFSVFLLSAFIIFLSFFVFPNVLSGSLDRFIHYRYSYIDNQFGIAFEISPGNYETFKGDRVNVTIKVKSNKPGLKVDEIEFFIKQFTPDGYEILSDSKDLKSSGDNLFYTTIENISTDLVYYAEYKEIRSEEYKIKISDYPIIKSLRITVTPPEFSGMPVKNLNENEGDIYCLEGSKIHFDIKASKELSSAGILLNDNFLNLSVQEEGASGIIEANCEGSYKIKLKDKKGNESRNEKIYNIKLIANEPPKITIEEPQEENYFIKNEKEILLKARIKDDFGFSKLNLSFRKSKSNQTASSNFSSVNIPIKNLNATEIEVPFMWYIGSLNIHSGDVIEYYMEVTDNSGKSTKSELRFLTYKSLSDILKKTEDVTKNLEEDLKAIFDDVKRLQEEIQELKKNNTEELGLNDPQKKLDLQNRLENLQNNMESTKQKMEKGMNDLQQKNMLSEKTLDQFMKLQEMFNKINTPEFREILKKMLEALKKNDMNQLREEMKNFHFDEEAFKKQIEQIMKLMQKIENLQKFGELTQKLDEITKQQEDLKNLTEKTNKDESGKMNTLANKQQDIKEQTQDFQEQLKKLLDELNKMKEDISPNDLQKLNKKMNQKSPQNKMQKSSNELMKGQKENSQDTQEDILDDLKEMNNDMQDALENAMDMQNLNKKMQDDVERIKNELEKLSKEQQELKEKSGDIKKNDKEGFQNSSKEQGDLKNRLTGDINDLMNMTKDGLQVTPELGKELGNAYNKMDKAENELQKSEKENAIGNQGKAKQSLDEAAKMLGDMLKQMKQDGKSSFKGQGRLGQLMQQLAKIIAQQQGLNGKMQQMGQKGNKGKDGKDGSEEMQEETKLQMERMKLEQEEIRKSLEQLNAEFEKEKERSGEKLLGDLKEVEKQMKETIKDLSEQRLDNRLLERQNRILSRMLDAQLSRREKDFEQKRESKPGENFIRTSPPEVVISGPNSINSLKDDFLRLQKEGYTEDYEALITKYFLELNNGK
jgi:chromosome segregation ATPase